MIIPPLPHPHTLTQGGNGTSSNVPATSSEQVFIGQNVVSQTTNQNANTMIFWCIHGAYASVQVTSWIYPTNSHYYGETNSYLVPKSYLCYSSDDDNNVTIWAINSANKCATIYGVAHYDSRTGGIPSKSCELESRESKSHESDSCESKCKDHRETVYGRNGTHIPKYDPGYASGLSH